MHCCTFVWDPVPLALTPLVLRLWSVLHSSDPVISLRLPFMLWLLPVKRLVLVSLYCAVQQWWPWALLLSALLKNKIRVDAWSSLTLEKRRRATSNFLCWRRHLRFRQQSPVLRDQHIHFESVWCRDYSEKHLNCTNISAWWLEGWCWLPQ